VLAAGVGADVVGEDADGVVYRWVGRSGSSWQVAFFNDGSSPRRVTVEVPGRVGFERWRPELDAWQRWPWRLDLEGATEVTVDLEPLSACGLRTTQSAVGATLLECDVRVEDLRTAEDGIPVVTVAETPARIEFATAGGAIRTLTVEHSDPGASELLLGDGWTLTVADAAPVPIAVDRGWESQGFETFAGVGTYRCEFELGEAGSAQSWELRLPAVECTATVRLNGTSLGARLWSPYHFRFPADLLRGAENVVEVDVANSAANRYYHGTPFQDGLQASGLASVPRLGPVSAAHLALSTP